MALPKSMRYLAGATFCIFVYLFVQILKAPGSETPVEIPSKLPTNKLGDWDHDPQLDRKLLRNMLWTWHKY
jgi:mannosyltransferase